MIRRCRVVWSQPVLTGGRGTARVWGMKRGSVGYRRPMHPVSDAPIRVVVADDSELVVRGLQAMLSPYAHAVTLRRPAGPGAPVPMCDVVLYDPTTAPRASSGGHHRPSGATRMVAYSWDCSPAVVTTELSRGAAGFVGKRVPADRLVRALMQAQAGQVVVDLEGPEQDRRPTRGSSWPLTNRETSVLALITQGYSNAEIVEQTQLSINSIKSYIRSAYRKMDVTSRSQAVLWGVQHGLLMRSSEDQAPAVTSLATVRPVEDDGAWTGRLDVARAQ